MQSHEDNEQLLKVLVMSVVMVDPEVIEVGLSIWLYSGQIKGKRPAVETCLESLQLTMI